MTVFGPQWSNDGGNPTKPRLWYWPWAGRQVDVELFFEPRDLWVGVFADKRRGTPGSAWERDWYRHIYICIVPCVPLHIWWAIR